MDFAYSDEQRMLVDTVRAFVAKELMPHEAEVERDNQVRAGADRRDPREGQGRRALCRQHARGSRRRRARRGRRRPDGARARPHLLRFAIRRRPALQHPARLQGRADRALSPAGDPRRAGGMPGHDRARRRLRSALHEDAGRARRRAFRPQRHQAFHQLCRCRRFRHPLRRLRRGGDQAWRQEEDHLLPRGQGHPRLRGAHGAAQRLPSRLPSLRARLHGLPHP